MIEVTNLSKKYNQLFAIKDLTFTIDRGEVVGFLGPNGAGKSTAMKILTCFMPPSEGDAIISGHSIHQNTFEIRKLIGYLPENNPLYTEMGVWDYLSFIAEIRRIPSHLKSLKIKKAIEKCQLGAVIQKDIYELSKGYRQRLGLAQALLHDPEILILDEPTIGLDPNQIIGIRHLIKELGKETTIILCSHILSEVEQTCSRVFILNNGKIVADGTPKNLTHQLGGEKLITIEVNQPFEAVQNVMMTSQNIKKIDLLSSADPYSKIVIRSDYDIRESIFQTVMDNQWKLKELSIEQTSLEHVFLQLTKEPTP